MIIPNQRSLFSIPEDIIYMNNANMSPLTHAVREAGMSAINTRSNPWKIKVNDWFEPAEELRGLFAQLIHADKENIALIPSVSYGIAIAATNITLNRNQNIVVIDQQYPSNIYAWRELAEKTGASIVTAKRKLGETWTDAILRQIDEHTGLVSIPNCHWTNGSFIDLVQISKKVKAVGSKFVVDASQSVGAYPLDVRKIQPDFLVTVGYKWLLGPYNLGYLYAATDFCQSGKPIEYSWLSKRGAEDFTKLVEYKDAYREGARRFDFGEFPTFIHLPMAIAALRQILEWGVENIQESLSILTDQIESRAVALGYETERKENRVGHMIGVNLSESQVAELGKKLPEQQVFVSFRGSSMRVAPHLFNEEKDVETLFSYL